MRGAWGDDLDDLAVKPVKRTESRSSQISVAGGWWTKQSVNGQLVAVGPEGRSSLRPRPRPRSSRSKWWQFQGDFESNHSRIENFKRIKFLAETVKFHVKRLKKFIHFASRWESTRTLHWGQIQGQCDVIWKVNSYQIKAKLIFDIVPVVWACMKLFCRFSEHEKYFSAFFLGMNFCLLFQARTPTSAMRTSLKIATTTTIDTSFFSSSWNSRWISQLWRLRHCHTHAQAQNLWPHRHSYHGMALRRPQGDRIANIYFFFRNQSTCDFWGPKWPVFEEEHAWISHRVQVLHHAWRLLEPRKLVPHVHHMLD